MRSQTSSPALCEEKEIPLLMERLGDRLHHFISAQLSQRIHQTKLLC
jgi:hypothetical protein